MRRALLGLLLMAPLAGCDEPPSARDEPAGVTSNGALMVPGEIVPQGTAPLGTAAMTAALAAPGPEPTPALLRRGRDRYGIFCAPCHGATGGGEGVVTRHGFPRPPAFADGRLEAPSAERIVAVITHGSGAMWPLAERIPPGDRWAIAAHVLSLRDGSAAPTDPSPGGAEPP